MYVMLFHQHPGLRDAYAPRVAKTNKDMLRSVVKKSCLFLRPRLWQFEI